MSERHLIMDKILTTLFLMGASTLWGVELIVSGINSQINGLYKYKSEDGDIAPPKIVQIMKVQDKEMTLEPGDAILVVCDPKNLKPSYCNGSLYIDRGNVDIVFTEAVINNGFMFAKIYRGQISSDGKSIFGTVVFHSTSHDDFKGGYQVMKSGKPIIKFIMTLIDDPAQQVDAPEPASPAR